MYQNTSGMPPPARFLQQVNQTVLDANLTWDMFYLDQRSQLYDQEDLAWWWEYDVLYACYDHFTGMPLYNQELLDLIANDMKRVLSEAYETGALNSWVSEHYGAPPEGQGVWDFVTNPALIPFRHPQPPNMPIGNGGSGNSSLTIIKPGNMGGDDYLIGNVTISSESLDIHAWDWQRYLGLGILLGTVLSTAFLMTLASYHQKRLREQQLWGNLGTPEGVDELLKTGWKVKGARMEVYDKSKMGYEDNDSMLIGGYEQKPTMKDVVECAPAAAAGEALTVTNPESETTPGAASRNDV